MNIAFASVEAATARERFRAAARDRAAVETVALPDSDGAITAARFGRDRADRLVILTGGLHGLEAPFGAAVIHAALTEVDWPDDVEVLLIPTLNPWGDANARRTDAENIDLNRNFLADDNYSGSPPGYARLNHLLNPPTPPGVDGFWLRLWWSRFTMGESALRHAVAGGQYEYPRGLFYGGAGPSRLRRLLESRWPTWTASASTIWHLDFHTGLGAGGIGKLLISAPPTSPVARSWVDRFGAELVESVQGGPTAYCSRGGFDDWVIARGGGRSVMSACAEFGTVGPVRVLTALRTENRAHFYAEAGSPAWRAAKAAALAAFAPPAVARLNAMAMIRRLAAAPG